MKKIVTKMAAALCGLMLSLSVMATDISGAGSTFAYPIFSKWAEAYKEKTGINLNYQSIGSGGGIKQIKAATVTFGASDKPLEPKELIDAGLIQFPAVIGGVVPVVNIAGIKAGDLVLDGPTLASIYLGEITKWNDPRIKALNPKLTLPNQGIAPAYRSDGSGTTFLFTYYLSEVSPTFKTKIGANASVEWPIGIGAKGNEGVAGMTTQTLGSIGYVEYAFAKQNKMAYVQMKNKDGKIVAPEATAFQAAAANADWAKADNYYLVLTNQVGAKSWPITGATFVLMHKTPKVAAESAEALKFFNWSYTNGNEIAASMDYVPMPANVVKLVQKTWATSVMADGKALWTTK